MAVLFLTEIRPSIADRRLNDRGRARRRPENDQLRIITISEPGAQSNSAGSHLINMSRRETPTIMRLTNCL